MLTAATGLTEERGLRAENWYSGEQAQALSGPVQIESRHEGRDEMSDGEG